jgi:hypothetical protein
MSQPRARPETNKGLVRLPAPFSHAVAVYARVCHVRGLLHRARRRTPWGTARSCSARPLSAKTAPNRALTAGAPIAVCPNLVSSPTAAACALCTVSALVRS